MQVLITIEGKSTPAKWCTELQEFQTAEKLCEASDHYDEPDGYYATTLEELLQLGQVTLSKA